MVKIFRDSVTLSDIWVSSNDKLSDFYASSWQRGESAVPMLVIRLVLSAISIAILTWSIVEGPSPYWLLYLTNWGLLLITSMTLSGVLVSIMALNGKVKDSCDVPWYIGVYWFTHNVAVSIAIMITVLYWVLLFDPESYNQEGRRLFWFDVATHGVNSCVALVELVSARTPLRALHFYQPLGLGLWYAGFTAIYYVAGGTDGNGEPYIYEILDWRNGRRAGSIVGIAVAGLVAIYASVYSLALCRDKVSEAFVRTTSHDLPPTPPDDFMHTRMV